MNIPLTLGIVVCLCAVVVWQIYWYRFNTQDKFTLRGLTINRTSITLESENTALFGFLKSPYNKLLLTFRETEDNLSLVYSNVDGTFHYSSRDGVSCYDIEWAAVNTSSELQDCYLLGKAHWYGGFQHVKQPWPLEKVNMIQTPYVSADLFFHGKSVGGVLERLFFNSDGFGVYIEDDVPLYVSINGSGDGKICLAAKHQGYPYLDTSRFPKLSYTVCQADNVKSIRRFMLNKYYMKPENIPDETLFYKPIWCTWAQYNKDINQSAVMKYAKTIRKYGFAHAQIEIDDEWTPFYGDLNFTKKKFPDVKQTINNLNKLGFRITVWIHPFINTNSQSFPEAASKGYLIKSRGDTVPALVRWWNGEMAGMLDVTNSLAADWFLEKLKRLQDEYNVGSFKFDAGESLYLPRNYAANEPLKCPDEYAKLWATLAYRSDTAIRHQEVRVAWKSQSLPIFVRIFDRSSTWDDMAGLKTLIPTILTFGLIGYPFVLADMVGGNAYDDLVDFKGGAFPNRELFIRWMEVNTFFPTIQYSIAPWIYDQEVVDLCKKYTELHSQYAPKMIKLAKDSLKTGDPIIRPIWWNSPHDETALTLDTEYLVGNDLLVAPVLEQGKLSRDVYLPSGLWKDMLRGGSTRGPTWLLDYKAELAELPYFTLLYPGQKPTQ